MRRAYGGRQDAPVANLKKLILETLFPTRCVSCGKMEDLPSWLCRSCSKDLTPKFKVFRPDGNLESVSSLFLYQEKIPRHLIHALKYDLIGGVMPIWEKILKKEAGRLRRLSCDLIVPLPLHARKLRERGFNQSELIARIVGEIIGKAVLANVLVKRRASEPQMKIKSRALRSRNVRGVFKVIGSAAVRDKSILLVDDVVTTGATLEEAARILRAAGAKKVYGFVLARD